MTAVILDGYTVPVQAESLVKSHVEIGSDERGYGGTLDASRRALKREWQFDTTYLTDAEAEFVENFIVGRGWKWSFDTSMWSDYGGVGPEVGYESALFTSGTPKFGTSTSQNSLRLNAAAVANGGISYKLPWWTASNTYTLMYYVYSSHASDAAGGWAAWNHMVIVNNKGTITVQRNGANYASALPAHVTATTSGSFTTYKIMGRNIADTAWTADMWIDDLVILPYAMDLTYATARYTFAGGTTTGSSSNLAFGDLPLHKLTGTAITESGPVTVRGKVRGVKFERAMISGVWTQIRSLQVTLTEV
jgi:hypothetical protein